MAKATAARFARNWPGIDADDLFGHLSLMLVEKRTILGKAENINAATSALLRKVATEYCGKERGRALYGTADYLYSTEEVDEIVSRVFLPPDDWGQAGRAGACLENDTKARDGMDHVTAVVDARQAWPRLPEASRQVIRDNWAHGPSAAAARSSVTLAAWSMRHGRAIRKLRDLMNTSRLTRTQDHDGPGSRKALSNADSHLMAA
ncbi:hypothetical protein [Streptacidiphilus albus]|uniref:hypothetical protein n=1 Tax=Streptacidiphilus albus TaxID=105425 RepID=UPI00054C6917|nr:hypothetical protein [Streptacidiphilus albus]